MSLLNESKKVWLLSFVILTVISLVLYLFAWENDAAKTVGIMLFVAQAVIAISFLIIVIFKVKKHFFKVLALLVYLGIVIYMSCNGILHGIGAIISSFIVVGMYMIWNLGGVINCVIAEWYKKEINTAIANADETYDIYIQLVRKYDDIFSEKVRMKTKEPKWNDYRLYVIGLDMFIFKDAITGKFDMWQTFEKNLEEIVNILSVLNERISIATNHISALQNEKQELYRITEVSGKMSKTNLSLRDIKNIEKWNKKIIKKHKRLLNKALESKII